VSNYREDVARFGKIHKVAGAVPSAGYRALVRAKGRSRFSLRVLSKRPYCGAGALGGAMVPGSGRETDWARGGAGAAFPEMDLSSSCARMYSQ
jgi:hypothetical protein